MKTIVENQSNISKYLFDDTKSITIKDDCTEVGSPIEFIIGDLNNTNCAVFDVANVPDDWVGGKYFFDGSDWTINNNWKPPADPINQPE